jgi:hypothetical protein
VFGSFNHHFTAVPIVTNFKSVVSQMLFHLSPVWGNIWEAKTDENVETTVR